jgi:hypothetical protein
MRVSRRKKNIPAGCSKSSSSKAAADESTGGVASALRYGCFRGENAAGGIFQHPAKASQVLTV